MVFEMKKENMLGFPEGSQQSDAAGLGPGPSGAFTRDRRALPSHGTCLGKLLFERVSNTAVTRTDTPGLTLETIRQPCEAQCVSF